MLLIENVNSVTELLKDPIIIRIVRILGITSLTILELLEYDLSRKDVNSALNCGVIEIDKAAAPIISITSTSDLLVIRIVNDKTPDGLTAYLFYIGRFRKFKAAVLIIFSMNLF